MRNVTKKTVLIVGCGDVARRAAPLLQKHYRIYGLYRNCGTADTLRALGIIPIYGDLDSPESLEKLAGIAQWVIHLAPPPNHGLHDTRTKHLLSALSKRAKRPDAILPQRLIYISTSGVYGNCRGALIDETCRTHPESDRAIRRLDAEKRIRAWSKRNHVAASILRVPGIYAADRLPLTRLRNGDPALLDNEDSYTNHIHAEDLARIICATLRYGKANRVYHTCDDSNLKMGAYFDLVADHFKLPRPPRIARAEAQTRLSAGILSFLNESRRLKNVRMKKELRIKLLFPTVREGILSIHETALAQ